MTVPAAVAHGGAGVGPHRLPNIEAAVSRAAEILEAGGSAVEAAIEACVILEDDPVFNAGSGAVFRMVRSRWTLQSRPPMVEWDS